MLYSWYSTFPNCYDEPLQNPRNITTKGIRAKTVSPALFWYSRTKPGAFARRRNKISVLLYMHQASVRFIRGNKTNCSQVGEQSQF